MACTTNACTESTRCGPKEPHVLIYAPFHRTPPHPRLYIYPVIMTHRPEHIESAQAQCCCVAGHMERRSSVTDMTASTSRSGVASG